MSFKIFKNTSGVVLIIVIMIVFLMSIICATIFTQSMSQSKTARNQINSIVAEELARGLYWKNYANSYHAGNPGYWDVNFIPETNPVITLNGVPFTSTITSSGGASSNIAVRISY